MFFHVRKWESQKPLPFSRKHIHIVPRDKLKTHLKETQKMIFIFLKENGQNFGLKIILKEIEEKKKGFEKRDWKLGSLWKAFMNLKANFL